MEYTVTVATGTSNYSGTNNYVYVTLVGENGESERTLLDNPGLDLCRGAVDKYIVRSPTLLGNILLVKLEKRRYWVEDNWFCCYVVVETPEGAMLTFPFYRWLVGDVTMELREGTAKKLSDESVPLLLAHRKEQLQERQKTYRWSVWAPGIPKCIEATSEAQLPLDVRFHDEKRSDFVGSLHYALLELSLKKLALKFGKSWDDLDDFKSIFWKLRSPISEYTMKHWKEDWFFGHQYLNGSNPGMIQQCRQLPDNFPVVEDMVQASLGPMTDLEKEMKAGNVYLLNYAVIEGVPANVIRNEPQYLAAPLCLLYEHPENGLIPIAIQLGQTPGPDTPIFLPSDPPLAWLLAKIWVRHSDFQVFQLLSHLLRTHLVVEVFCVATLRQLPDVHPIYKLLKPHLRYTLEINCRGRDQLVSPDGIFKKVTSTGGAGILVLAQNGYKTLTYRSIQPCLDFQDRGVTKLRNYFYKEDSLMLWDVIHNFISGMVFLYYSSDDDVSQDAELQAWIRDVTQEGFVDIPEFGLASELKTRKELITLLATVIFTTTGQHAATNNGQFDWCAWVPNTPCTMRQPVPTDKDAVTMEMIMESLPDVSQSCVEMAITWHLSRTQPDAVSLLTCQRCVKTQRRMSQIQAIILPIPLGQYPEQYFTEPPALDLIERLQQELHQMEEHIVSRNKGLELPYHYMCPCHIENSITI